MSSDDEHVDERRAFIWLFTGMITQWNGMGKDLLKIEVFRKTIERCQSILDDKGLDLVHILTSDDPSIFENVLNSFVGIGAVQLGMINILREIGLEPDILIGPSFGEVAIGYADGCLTEEQAVLSAYYRGLVTIQGSKTVGRMGFIGLGYEQVETMVSEDLDVSGHMDNNASVVSGPKESVEAFVEKMKSEGVLGLMMQSSNVAFHSRCISHLAPTLLKHMKEIIPEAKLRSEKWLSVSAPYDQWNQPEVKLCSGEYYTNNYVNNVYLKETCQLCPMNSIVLEVSPHSSLSRSIYNNIQGSTHIGLADRRRSNQVDVFLQALHDLSKNEVLIDWEKVEKVFNSNTNGSL